MKTPQRILAAVLLAGLAGTALAQEGVQDSTWIPKASTLTRSDVRAAIDAAKLNTQPAGEASYTVVAASTSSALKRIQVQAEGREAMRLGLMSGGEGGARAATPAEAEQIRLAGQRAVEAATTVAAK